MTPSQFHRWFRMDRCTFENLAEILKFDEQDNLFGRKPMDFNKRLAMTLTFMGTQIPSFQWVKLLSIHHNMIFYHNLKYMLIFSICSLAQTFGICEESFLRQTTNMMDYLILNMKHFIIFPRKQDFPRVIRQFDAIGRYHNFSM